MSDAALRLEEVAFTYGAGPDAVPALDGVSLSVAPGEGVALLGPNGAGKTTLTRLAMALLHPRRGRVVSAGRDTGGLAPEALADRVGYVFQHPEAQLFARTVRDELAFGPARLGWPAERVAAAVDAVLGELELAADAATHPYDLPAPRRRLVALGAALVAGPRLLLLDEPTSGLDRASRALVQRVVRTRRAAGCAVLAVTHDPAFAVECLDRGVVLRAGRIERDGPLAEVLELAAALPPHAAVARRLGLAPATLRLADVAAALAERLGRCPGGGAGATFPNP